MSALCEFVNRNVGKLKLLEKVENHPKFPAKYRGDIFQKYLYGLGTFFHVYMLLAGWIGVWSFFSKCPSLQLYEKLVLVSLRLAVMAVHVIGTGFFLLGCVGGSALPVCERVTHLYHQFMVCYQSAVLPMSMLCMIGSLLSLSLDQFGMLLIFTPLEAICLVWHILVCDAFLRWGNAPTDTDIPGVGARTFYEDKTHKAGRSNDTVSNKQPQGTAKKSDEQSGKSGGKDAPKNSSFATSGNKTEKNIGSKSKKDSKDDRHSD